MTTTTNPKGPQGIEVAVDSPTGPRSNSPPRSVAANIFSLATSQAITWTLTLIWTFFVPRMLGPSQMGVLVIATSVTSVAALMLNVTPRDFLVREMVSDRVRAPGILVSALLARVAAIPFVFLAAIVYGRIAGLDTQAMYVMILVACATVCGLLLEPAVAVFQATERMQFIAYTDVANKSLQTIGGVLLVVAGFGVVALAGFSLVITGLALALALFWAHRLISLRARPTSIVPMVRKSAQYWVVAVFFVGYLWADGFLLGILAPTEVVGWYGAATRLFTTMMFVAVIISTASLPRLVAAHTQNPALMYKTARMPFEWVLILGLPVGLGIACVADEVVPFLYGAEYHGSVIPLTILGVCLPFIYANIMINQVFIASGRPMMTARLLAVAAGVNVGLNLVLIPFAQRHWENGAIGSAVSMLVAEGVQLGLALLIIGSQLLHKGTFARVIKATAAAGVMTLVLLLVDGVLFPIQIVVGALVFLLLCLLLRLPTTDELKRARSAGIRLRERMQGTEGIEPGASG